MLNTNRIVLVTGATGNQGSAVIRHMLPKGWKLRALVYSADESALRTMTNQGIEVVRGDFDDPASLERAMNGVYGVYSDRISGS